MRIAKSSSVSSDAECARASVVMFMAKALAAVALRAACGWWMEGGGGALIIQYRDSNNNTVK